MENPRAAAQSPRKENTLRAATRDLRMPRESKVSRFPRPVLRTTGPSGEHTKSDLLLTVHLYPPSVV
jgi:hypothetical protein